jgi:hypothetical protein
MTSIMGSTGISERLTTFTYDLVSMTLPVNTLQNENVEGCHATLEHLERYSGEGRSSREELGFA